VPHDTITARLIATAALLGALAGLLRAIALFIMG
jgi:hypothetical protein